MAGLPGVGKSSLVRELAALTRLPFVSVEPIEGAMWAGGIGHDQPTGLAAYEVAKTVAGELLACGLDVIVDAVNAEEVARNMWRRLAAEFSVPVHFVECRINDREVHRQRLESRRRPSGMREVDWSDVEKRRSTFEAWQDPPIAIDSTNDVLENAEYLVGVLSLNDA